ncbi:MAG: hypothetical protein ACOCXP_02540 [Candidatus Dojkabacteria bacterium]
MLKNKLETSYSRALSPKSICIDIVGTKDLAIAKTVVANLHRVGYSGNLYVISEKEEFLSYKTDPSYKALGKRYDLLVISSDRLSLAELREEIKRSKLSGILLLETVSERYFHALQVLAEEESVVLFGDSSIGIINLNANLNLSYLLPSLRNSSTALLSDSSAITSVLVDKAIQDNLGLGYVIDLGSNFNESILSITEYFAANNNVASIAIYASDPPQPVFNALNSLANEVEKSILLYDPSKDIDDFYDALKLQTKFRKPLDSRKFSLITNLDGKLTYFSRELNKFGFEMDAEVLAQDATAKEYAKAIESHVRKNDTSIITVVVASQTATKMDSVSKSILQAAQHSEKIICPVFLGGSIAELASVNFSNAGMVSFSDFSSLVAAIDQVNSTELIRSTKNLFRVN